MSTSKMTLFDWIQRARVYLPEENYLVCAIFVAEQLAYRLSLQFKACNATSPDNSFAISSLPLKDIVLENVELFFDFVPDDKASPASYKPTDVLVVPPGSKSKRSGCHKPTNNTPTHLMQRDVCFALGKILFELFSSQGSSKFLYEEKENKIEHLNIKDVESGETTSSQAPGRGSESTATGDIWLDEQDMLKKLFLSGNSTTLSSTKSIQASESLQAQNLPLSICVLISDLLDAEEGNEFMPDTALVSLKEVHHDLSQMKNYPERFLADQLCPRHALNMATLSNQLNDELYGREKEIDILMKMACRVSEHMRSKITKGFLCDAAFISGHGGSGKTSLIRRLVLYWNSNDWPVLFCKFDRQSDPLTVLMQSFDVFFGKFVNQVGGMPSQRGPFVQVSFDQMTQAIISSIDSESFAQLCLLLPSFGKLFPMSAAQHNAQQGREQSLSADTDNMGSGRNRMSNMLHILFNAVCSGRQPALICLEDLHCADLPTVDIIGGYITQSIGFRPVLSNEEDSQSKGGMLLLGSFRDDEVPVDGFLMDKIRLLEHAQGQINVSKIFVDELTEESICDMLSFRLCLPLRYVRELSRLVSQKTRGHPLFVNAFLGSMIESGVISFSVRARRWIWEDLTIDLQVITEDVAIFLTKKLKQLPNDVRETLKVVSCFGQVNEATVEVLDLSELIPSMIQALKLAVEEGLLEKAGPVYTFSHDLLQESTYRLIPAHERNLMHKKIGASLVQNTQNAENSELCILAVDQINTSINLEGTLDQTERLLFARLNLVAGKHAMSARKSNYKQAGVYFEAGISLLSTNHWQEQYSLSLELYNSSVLVSFMIGNVSAISTRLSDILAHAMSFDDAVDAHVLRAKYLASQAQYAGAFNGVLEILSAHLGESFPEDITESMIREEVNSVEPMLRDITKEKILRLPAMTNKQKLYAMRFMDLLASLSSFSSPMLHHLVSCRMTRLTFKYGFSDYSISCLALISRGILHYSEENNVILAGQISRTAEMLINDHSSTHSLRARLTAWLIMGVGIVEPFQANMARAIAGYKSATIVGDVDSALMCGFIFSGWSLFGCKDLRGNQKTLGNFLCKMVKHKRSHLTHICMSYFDVYTEFIGKEDSCSVMEYGIEMKTNKELYQLAERSKNIDLMQQVALNQMCVLCFFREYQSCAELTENYQVNNTPKRSMDSLIIFYSGVSALNLALSTKQGNTKQTKWRSIGEQSLKAMTKLVEYSTWNFENKQLLLQALVHHLNGRKCMAEMAYQTSIISARDHKFIPEQALAYELYGIFLANSQQIVRGVDQIKLAHSKYKECGAMGKVKHVEDLIKKLLTYLPDTIEAPRKASPEIEVQH